MWSSAVPISAPWSVEGNVVAILFMDRDTMITILGIENCLLLDGSYRSGMVEGRLGMVSLPSGMGVKWLDFNNPAGIAALLRTYNGLWGLFQ